MIKKSNLLFLIIIVSLFSCKTNENGKEHKEFFDINKFYIKEIGYRNLDINQVGKVLSFYDSLTAVDSLDQIMIEQRKYNSAKYYYYSILDTVNINSFVYYYFNEDKEEAFELANYDKSGKLIDHTLISSICGDGGDFYNSNGKFVNDSTIIRDDEDGYCKWADLNPEYKMDKIEENDSIVFTRKCQLKMVIQKNGKIKTDTLYSKGKVYY